MAATIDVGARPDGAYRIVVWNVGPSIERKYSKLRGLQPNVAVVPRCGDEVRLLRNGRTQHTSMGWVGRHAQRGLGVIGFEPSVVRLDGRRWDQRLEWIAPMQVTGLVSHQLLAIWALNEKAQVTFKSRPMANQPMQAMTLYRKFLAAGPSVIAGDFNNNPVFHANDPTVDMLELVALLDAAGYTSAYHAFTGLEHGDPREVPTRFRSDRKVGRVGRVGHHTDYCFVPKTWVDALLNVQVGSTEVWANVNSSESHVPLVFDFDAEAVKAVVRSSPGK